MKHTPFRPAGHGKRRRAAEASKLRHNLRLKELLCGLRRYRINGISDGNANALLSLHETERARDLYLILQMILLNKAAQRLDHLARAFEVTGASDTYCYFHFVIPPF